MKLHANARTCPNSRRLLVERVGAGWSLAEAAAAAGVSDRTAAKWLARSEDRAARRHDGRPRGVAEALRARSPGALIRGKRLFFRADPAGAESLRAPSSTHRASDGRHAEWIAARLQAACRKLGTTIRRLPEGRHVVQ